MRESSRKNPVNEEIESAKVLLIDQEGKQLGVKPTPVALEMARGRNFDLVLVAGQADPPVAKMLDYGKHIFTQQKGSRRKQKKVQLKEVRFRPRIEDGDYQVKLARLIRFLSAGDKVKVTIMFRGREMTHMEIGVRLLERIQADLAEHATTVLPAKMEGRFLAMVLTSSQAKRAAAKAAKKGKPQVADPTAQSPVRK